MEYTEEAIKLAKAKDLPEDYIQSMLDWSDHTDRRLSEIVIDAAYLGLTPKEYLDQFRQDESTRQFLAYKGFADLKSEFGYHRTLKWLQGADADDLFITDGNSCAEGNLFDTAVAEMRRTMMLQSLVRIAQEPDVTISTLTRPTEEELNAWFPELSSLRDSE